MPQDGRGSSPQATQRQKHARRESEGSSPAADAGATGSAASSEAASPPVVSREILSHIEQSLLQSQSESIAIAVQNAMAASAGAITAQVTQAVSADTRRQVASLEAKLARDRREVGESIVKLESTVDMHGDMFGRHDADLAMLHTKLAKMQADLGSAVGAPAPDRPVSTQYDRPVDYSILKVRVQQLVTRESVEKMVTALASKVSIEAKLFKIVGDSPSRAYDVQFAGAPQIAARAAAKVLGALNLGGGKWLQLEADIPDGSVAKAWIDLDKNQKTINIERAGKHLKKIAATILPAKQFIWRRRDGVLFEEGWIPVAKLDSNGPQDMHIKWCDGCGTATALRDGNAAQQLREAIQDPAHAARWV